MKTKYFSHTLCVILFCFVSSLQAADGQNMFLQQQQREQQQRSINEPQPAIFAAQISQDNDVLPENESPCFLISQIQLTGLHAENFQYLIDAANQTEAGEKDVAVGRCLGKQGIFVVLKRMQNKLLSDGYITSKVVLAQQNISNHVLSIVLIPGIVNNISFENTTNTRATKINAMAMDVGDTLNLRDIEQSLENFKRLPSAEADIEILPTQSIVQENEQTGKSDLLIKWQQKAFPFRLTTSVDDSGTRSTGKLQGNVTLSYDHALT
ncbi:MAG: ShlB/FhaC/HecB family hemolysin secretion/activation protein, partial [Proteobacteria bacterium]|nr:ShlB/FhaC/HecB family hemolysin secretion/activation protein [Pseudomonadota bacterium]